jgi:GT2 family glycosyltransferase
MIPVIGVPIVNGVHWLERLISSVDYPTDTLLVINNNGRGELDEDLLKISKQPHPYINRIYICNLPSNIGVSGAWNLIIKSFINSPYWFICNHDIAFTPGLLSSMVDKISDPNNHIVHASMGEFNLGTYDLFAMSSHLVQTIGLFDENLYPAYCEDTDYVLRITRYNWNNPPLPIKVCGVDIPHYHGNALSTQENSYELEGSQTKRVDPYLEQKLTEVNFTNFNYMTKKWGDAWRNTCPQLWPYGIPNLDVSFYNYDLEFAKSKYLGF